MKTCSKCKIEKELTEFNKYNASKDGLKYQCKSCEKEYWKEYHQKNRDNRDFEIIKKLKEKGVKKCNKCKTSRFLDDFYKSKGNKDGLCSICKSCQKKHNDKTKDGRDFEFIKQLKEKGIKVCSNCKIEKPLTEFSKTKRNKDGLEGRCRSCAKEYREANADAERNRKKEYYQANKERLKEYSKEYRQANKEYCKEYRKEWQRNKRQTDNLFKMRCYLGTRTWAAFKNKGYSKNTKTQEMLGVDWEICKAHIERQFTKGMNWDNQGEWHIDHIIPLASANNEEELKKLCHYSNLQPLWAEDNLKKKDKITGQQSKLRF